MHKLTNDRMKWGASALMAGVALGAAALLVVKLRSHPGIVGQHPGAGLYGAAPLRMRPRVAGPKKHEEDTSAFAVELRHPTASHTRVRVYQRRTGQTVWTRTLSEVQVVRWSKDRQALAVIGTRNEDACSFVLHVWRNGERVRTIRHILPLDLWDSAQDAIWSPDNRRLLLVGQRGMGVPCLDLWCFRLRDSRTWFVALDVIQEEWVNPTRGRYWKFSRVFDWRIQSCSSAPETLHEWDCLTPEPSVPEEFRHNLKQREEVVALARAGKLASADPSEIPLPARYRHLSGDGEIQMQQGSGNTTVVFSSRADGCVESRLLYEANGQPPDDGPWDIVKKLAPHWFWVSM